LIFIDRRKATRGKSTANRQKLLRRIRSFIKASSPQNIGKFGGVTGNNYSGAPTGGASSPVKVTGKALEEPRFMYSRDDENTIVLIGNSENERGDEIHINTEESSGNGAGQGNGGEDDFIVTVARDEFLDLYYEDCELPNLVNEKYTEKLDNKWQHAGFSHVGNPAQLSIIRTYKTAVGRRRAMSAPYLKEKHELELELAEIRAHTDDPAAITAEDAFRIDWIMERIGVLNKKIAFLRGFDNSDLRFRKKEAQPLKTVDAVIFFLMDISGSMDEKKKMIARRWFALEYGFIKRRYPATELVFIAHTDEAFEMSENDFFSTRVNGGTSASTAFHLVNKIIRERYDPNQTNIYVSHASDGDNWMDDDPKVYDELVGEGSLMKKIQFLSYAEVGQNGLSAFASLMGSNAAPSSQREDSGLWKVYTSVQEKVGMSKVVLALLPSADECYQVFKKVFRKKGPTATRISP
jgi:uncharacterized protein